MPTRFNYKDPALWALLRLSMRLTTTTALLQSQSTAVANHSSQNYEISFDEFLNFHDDDNSKSSLRHFLLKNRKCDDFKIRLQSLGIKFDTNQTVIFFNFNALQNVSLPLWCGETTGNYCIVSVLYCFLF